MNNYFIKSGYQCNLDINGMAIPFDDDEGSAAKYQVNVYCFAANLIKKQRIYTVLDIGCGYGLKLRDIIYPVCKNIVGIDREHAINYCREEHNFGKWHVVDIESPVSVLDGTFDLIIASDVIEHLVNPDKLLDYIKRCSHRRTQIVISTPERDIISGAKDMGPPINKSHVREWNRAELRNYICHSGMQIIEHFVIGEAGVSTVDALRNLIRRRPMRKCQVVLCSVIR